MLVSALAFAAVKHGIADADVRVLIAPLVTFLPGGPLTTSTVELACGEMVAGASRLVFGGLQMLLLAFGIVAGTELVGLPGEQVLHDTPASLVGGWAPWFGVVVSESPSRSTSRLLAARCTGSCSSCLSRGSDSFSATGSSVRTRVASSVRSR